MENRKQAKNGLSYRMLLGSSVSKDDVRGFAYNEDQNCVGDFSGEMEGNPVILRKLDLTQIIDFFGLK